MKVGFIGLGIMGSRMAANILKNIGSLNVYNRTKSKAEELVKSGAIFYDDLKKFATDCDVIFTMLSEPNAVKQVILYNNDLLSSFSNKIWIDCTTVSPTFSILESRVARQYNIQFCDAPVAGTKNPAQNAQLTFFIGGESSTIDKVEYLLNFMGSNVVRAGAVSKGSAIKLAVNVLLGISMAAYSEALNLGEVLGIEKTTLIDILNNLPITSKFLSLKKNKIESGNYEPEFPLQWMHKDLFLASEEAFQNNLAMPSTNAVKELFGLAKSNGYGELDLSFIYQFLKRK